MHREKAFCLNWLLGNTKHGFHSADFKGRMSFKINIKRLRFIISELENGRTESDS